MSLPGLDQLAAIHPGFAAAARRLGEGAWHSHDRTPRETAACLLGLDLAHGLLDMPLRLHATMALQLGVTGGYLSNVLVSLAPLAGYPGVAQALVNTADLLAPAERTDLPTPREHDFATVAWTSSPAPTTSLPVASLIEEFGHNPHQSPLRKRTFAAEPGYHPTTPRRPTHWPRKAAGTRQARQRPPPRPAAPQAQVHHHQTGGGIGTGPDDNYPGK